MFFKGKKSNSENPNNPSFSERLNQDFVVHNMPSPVSSEITVRKQSLAAPENHKKTGIMIISGGIILVTGLLYGAYVLIIQPSLETKAPVTEEIVTELPVQPVVQENQPTEIIASSSVESPVIAPITVEAPTTTVNIEEIVTPVQASIIDADSDGLSDEEERLIGSNPNKIDSDGDGNADLIELQNSYNPSGSGRLSSSLSMINYRNPALKYSLIYPKEWLLKNLNDNETILISSADEKYFIQVIHQFNSQRLDISDWYQTEFPDQQAGEVRIAADGSWQGVYNQDKNIFYLSDMIKQNIYIFSLGATEGNTINHERLFELVINSFRVNTK
jgi:hypothetical protein